MSTMYLGEPGFRYRIRLADGGEILADPRDCTKVIDSRTPEPHARPQVVWEVLVNGVVRRLWPEHIAGMDMEAM